MKPITATQVVAIRKMRDDGATYKEIAVAVGTSEGTVGNVILGKRQETTKRERTERPIASVFDSQIEKRCPGCGVLALLSFGICLECRDERAKLRRRADLRKQ